MARYKRIDTSPRFLPVVWYDQLLPGAFKHALNHLLNHELDRPDWMRASATIATGAPAWWPLGHSSSSVTS